MKLRGVSLAAGLFLLALSLWGQPAEAAVSPSFYPPLPPSTPVISLSGRNYFLSLYLPFSSALAKGIPVCPHLLRKKHCLQRG